MIITIDGDQNIILTPGNDDDSAPTPALVDLVNGSVMVGDLGPHGPECTTALAEAVGMLLMTRDRVPEHKFLLIQVRYGIETTFSRW